MENEITGEKAFLSFLSSEFLESLIAKVLGLIKREDKEIKNILYSFLEKGVKVRQRMDHEIKDLQEKIRKDPLNIDYRIRKIRLESTNPSVSIEQARELVDIVPEDKLDIAYSHLSFVYFHTIRSLECLKSAEKALAINPQNAVAKVCLSQAIQQPECFSETSNPNERIKKAFQLLDEAISEEPDELIFVFFKCWTLKMNGDLEESLSLLQQKVKPMLTWEYEHLYYAHVGSVYYDMNYREEAITNALKAFLLEPRSLTSMFILSTAFDAYHDFEIPLDLGERYIRGYRSSQKVSGLEERLQNNLAINYMNAGKFDRAIELCQECLKNRYSPRAHAIIANCMYYRATDTNYDEAMEHCEKAMFSEEKISQVNGHIPKIYARMLFERDRIFEAGIYNLIAEERDSCVFIQDRIQVEKNSDMKKMWMEVLNRICKFFQKLIFSSAEEVHALVDGISKSKKTEEEKKIFKDLGNKTKSLHRYYSVCQWVKRMKCEFEDISKFHNLLEERELLFERWDFVVESLEIGEKKRVVFVGKNVIIEFPKFMYTI